MLIIEGPDGSGKSTLVERLQKEFGLPLHERASNSKQGPIENLFDWAYRDVITMPNQPLAIYDRHPLISEYIYAPIIRKKLGKEFLCTAAHLSIRMLARDSLVVICRPPNERLIASVSADRDMPGVSQHTETIAGAYDAMTMFWPGPLITYDYTQRSSLNSLISRCRIHIAQKRTKA